MQGPALTDTDEWAMPERRERAVMRDVPEKGTSLKANDDFRFPSARGVLSKDEIEALLRPNLPKINEQEAVSQEAEQPFARSFGESASKSAEGNRLASRLTLLFAQATGLKAAFRFVSEQAFESFETASAAPGPMGAVSYISFGNDEDAITHIFELPAALGNALVSHACGGTFALSDDMASRELSAIDCALIEQLLSPLRCAFGSDTKFLGIETDPGYVASLVPDQPGHEMRFDTKVARENVQVRLHVMSEGRAVSSRRAAVSTPGKRPVSALLTARMASLSVPVSQLSNLKRGDTLLLGLPADQPVELLSGGRDGVPAFEGDIGRKGKNMAVRIRKSFDS